MLAAPQAKDVDPLVAVSADGIAGNARARSEAKAGIPGHSVLACASLDGGNDCLRDSLIQIGLDSLGHGGHLADIDEMDSQEPGRN